MELDKIKLVFVGVFTLLSARLSMLAIPVYLLVACNVIDYGTGLAAARKRGQTISSSVGLNGIIKKVCMWLLVGVGAIFDILLAYAAEQAGIVLNFGYTVACMVAIWLICNEIISILENVGDIGVNLPPFLKRVVESLKSQVESKTDVELPAELQESSKKNVK